MMVGLHNVSRSSETRLVLRLPNDFYMNVNPLLIRDLITQSSVDIHVEILNPKT